jgi:hypothetical protein
MKLKDILNIKAVSLFYNTLIVSLWFLYFNIFSNINTAKIDFVTKISYRVSNGFHNFIIFDRIIMNKK